MKKKLLKRMHLFAPVGAMDTLPQFLAPSAPVLTENFETVGDWTVLTGSAAANTTELKTGTQSVTYSPHLKVGASDVNAGRLVIHGDFFRLRQYEATPRLKNIQSCVVVSI